MLPLRKRSDLLAAPVRQSIIDLSEGITVRIARLIESLAIEAIRSGKENIDEESLSTIPFPAPLLSMTERKESPTLT
jgi:hypothetical protein